MGKLKDAMAMLARGRDTRLGTLNTESVPFVLKPLVENHLSTLETHQSNI